MERSLISRIAVLLIAAVLSSARSAVAGTYLETPSPARLAEAISFHLDAMPTGAPEIDSELFLSTIKANILVGGHEQEFAGLSILQALEGEKEYDALAAYLFSEQNNKELANKTMARLQSWYFRADDSDFKAARKALQRELSELNSVHRLNLKDVFDGSRDLNSPVLAGDDSPQPVLQPLLAIVSPKKTVYKAGERLIFGEEPIQSHSGSQLSPATVWSVGDDASYKQRVHALSARGGELLINGKPANRFGEKKIEGDLVTASFLHPDDPGLLVKVYQSASLDGFVRKIDKLKSLEPLSAAGAAPKLIEHGEAAVVGLGRVYFYVQELARGQSLQEFMPKKGVAGAVGRLFARLASSGIRLSVPDRDWLLSHLLLGETASGGTGLYLMDGAIDAAHPEELKAHYDMLRSVLRPAPSKTAQPEIVSSPAMPAPASRETSVDFAALAEKLANGSDVDSFSAGRELETALWRDPKDATPELEKKLRATIDGFVSAAGSRKATTDGDSYYGYDYSLTGLPEGERAQVDGHWAPKRRVRDAISLYNRLASRRSDLVSSELIKTLNAAFAAKLVLRAGPKSDVEGDQAVAATLTSLFNLAKLVGGVRPDLLTTGELTRLAETLRTNNGADASRFGAGAFVRDAYARAMDEISSLIVAVAMGRPVEEVREALTRFDVDRERWLPRRGFEDVVAGLLKHRADFERSLHLQPTPVVFESKRSASAPGEAPFAENDADPLALRYHWLPRTLTKADFEESLTRAEHGGRLYLELYRKAKNTPVVRDPAAFYADSFGLGQLLWTGTEIGARISVELVESEARRIWKTHFLPGAEGYDYAAEQFEVFLRRVLIGDRDSPNHLRKEIHQALLEASLLPAGYLASYFIERGKRYDRADAFRRAENGKTLKSLEKFVLDYMARQDPRDMELAGVIVTGSYVYGAPHPDSDLDVYLLTDDGSRDERFVTALEKAREENHWPALKDIRHAQVYRSDSSEARKFVREFPSVVISPNAELVRSFEGLSVTKAFWKTTRWQRFRHAFDIKDFRRRLRRRLF